MNADATKAGDTAKATLGLLGKLKVDSGGFKRNDDGLSSYDNNEWILVDLRIANALRRAGRGSDADGIIDVLSEGIEHGGTTLRDYRTVDGGIGANQHRLDCYGRSGRPCHRCGATLRRSVVDGRGTTHCPTCQRR